MRKRLLKWSTYTIVCVLLYWTGFIIGKSSRVREQEKGFYGQLLDNDLIDMETELLALRECRLGRVEPGMRFLETRICANIQLMPTTLQLADPDLQRRERISRVKSSD